MERKITKADFEMVRSYFAKANKDDDKRTEYKVGINIPGDVTQENFDKYVDHVWALGLKNLMYLPEKPDQFDFTKHLHNPAFKVKVERVGGLPQAVVAAINAAMQTIAVWEANKTLAKKFAANAKGRSIEQFKADGMAHLAIKALGDKTNPKKEKYAEKYAKEILTKCTEAVKSGVVIEAETEDF
jgi:hypothetical protein